MQQWNVLANSAKKAYTDHSYKDAIKLNENALLVSKESFDTVFYSKDPEKAIALVLASYFNIIDNHIAEKRFVMANTLFEDAFYFLENKSHRFNHKPRQYTSIISGVKKLYIEWSLFLNKNKERLPEKGEVWTDKLPRLISSFSNKHVSTC